MALTPDSTWTEAFRTAPQDARVVCRIYPLRVAVEAFQFLDQRLRVELPASLASFTVADASSTGKSIGWSAKQTR